MTNVLSGEVISAAKLVYSLGHYLPMGGLGNGPVFINLQY